MKIIFWGETAPFETTQNMYTLAALIAKRCPGHPIRMYRFRGMGEEYYHLYREQTKRFRECSAYESNSHGRNVSKPNLCKGSACENGAYQKSAGTGIGEELEFYDFGAKRDNKVFRQMREADVLVLNMPQESRAWEWLIERRMVCYENVLYLLSGYQLYNMVNREFIEHMYRIERQNIGLIPYNNEFVYFTRQGKLAEFLETRYRGNEKNRLFMQELQRTVTLLLRHMKMM